MSAEQGAFEPVLVNPLQEIDDDQQRQQLQEKFQSLLKLPRRPQWSSEMDPNQLDKQERAVFLEWRRNIARQYKTISWLETISYNNKVRSKYELCLCVCKVVDARDPLLYFSTDLQEYAQQIDPSKKTLVLLNKADLLSKEARQEWAKYFDDKQIQCIFWSAYLAEKQNKIDEQNQQLQSIEEKDFGQDDSNTDDYNQLSNNNNNNDLEINSNLKQISSQVEGDNLGHQDIDKTTILNTDQLLQYLRDFAKQTASQKGKTSQEKTIDKQIEQLQNKVEMEEQPQKNQKRQIITQSKDQMIQKDQQQKLDSGYISDESDQNEIEKDNQIGIDEYDSDSNDNDDNNSIYDDDDDNYDEYSNNGEHNNDDDGDSEDDGYEEDDNENDTTLVNKKTQNKKKDKQLQSQTYQVSQNEINQQQQQQQRQQEQQIQKQPQHRDVQDGSQINENNSINDESVKQEALFSSKNQNKEQDKKISNINNQQTEQTNLQVENEKDLQSETDETEFDSDQDTSLSGSEEEVADLVEGSQRQPVIKAKLRQRQQGKLLPGQAAKQKNSVRDKKAFSQYKKRQEQETLKYLLAQKEKLEQQRQHQQQGPQFYTIGLVGYPNVGKSSTINALYRKKKTAVAATPGKTKHFQTLIIDSEITLCDCPGMVMPKFAHSKAQLVSAAGVLKIELNLSAIESGHGSTVYIYLKYDFTQAISLCSWHNSIRDRIIPIDRLTDVIIPISIILGQVPKGTLKQFYNIKMSNNNQSDTFYTNSTTNAQKYQISSKFLQALALQRQWVIGGGLPDINRTGRIVLKDFTEGRIPFFKLPPSCDLDLKPAIQIGQQSAEPEVTPCINNENTQSQLIVPQKIQEQQQDTTLQNEIAQQQIGQISDSQNQEQTQIQVQNQDQIQTQIHKQELQDLMLDDLDLADLDLMDRIKMDANSKQIRKRPEYKYKKKQTRTKGNRGKNFE